MVAGREDQQQASSLVSGVIIAKVRDPVWERPVGRSAQFDRGGKLST